MPKYTVEPIYRWGEKMSGEYRIMRDGEITSVYGFDHCQLEELCAVLNLITPEQREEARKIAYRRTILGEAA